MSDEINNRDEDILLFDEEDCSDFLDNPESDETELIVDEPIEEETAQTARTGGNQSVNRPGGLSNQSINRGGFQTDVDLVFVIDCTGSMEPFLSLVKYHAKSLYRDITEGLGAKNRQVHKMRIKVIAYRDFYFDWADPEHPPFLESEFFNLPEDEEAYAAFVDRLEYAGGEDEPESALEALHLAFNSRWLVDPTIPKRRQIVMLFTDASAHPLNDPMRFNPQFNAYYPGGIPESLEALEAEFMSPDVFPSDGGGYPSGHRLVIFAPENMYPWDQIKNWSETSCRSMDPENGLEGLSMDEIILFISGSL